MGEDLGFGVFREHISACRTDWLSPIAILTQETALSRASSGQGGDRDQRDQRAFEAADFGSYFDNTLEVYFGGELVGTIDTDGRTMETYDITVTAGSGDGTDVLSFVETGTSDYGGTAIDNIRMYEMLNEGDSLSGGAGEDTIVGGSGDDTVSAGEGDDVAYLGNGDDLFDTTDGDPDVGDGADTVYGEAGNDTIYGGGSADVIDGGIGNDSLHGETGDDTLSGGLGDDTLSGGDGADVFMFAEGDGHDQVQGGSGGSWVDQIDLDVAAGDVMGIDWTITVTDGSIEGSDANGLDLSDDADGYIEFDDGSRIDFFDIERVAF